MGQGTYLVSRFDVGVVYFNRIEQIVLKESRENFLVRISDGIFGDLYLFVVLSSFNESIQFDFIHLKVEKTSPLVSTYTL